MASSNCRDLTKSNTHFKKGLQRPPLGVASAFCYWGEERTFYVRHGKAGRLGDIDDYRYVDYRLGHGLAIQAGRVRRLQSNLLSKR